MLIEHERAAFAGAYALVAVATVAGGFTNAHAEGAAKARALTIIEGTTGRIQLGVESDTSRFIGAAVGFTVENGAIAPRLIDVAKAIAHRRAVDGGGASVADLGGAAA